MLFLKRLIITLLTSFPFVLSAQVGGNYVYSFLNHVHSARTAALGGKLITTPANDPSLLITNPSLISSKYHTSLTTSIVDYFADATYASALYSHTFDNIGSFAFEMRYAGYGDFTRTDVTGLEMGTFSVNDFATTIGWGRRLDSLFSIGANLKFVFSNYESAFSFGIAADVAGTYYNAEKDLSLSLVIKNLGGEITPYEVGELRNAPFDIQLAFSQKMKYMPVRYHISLHTLYKWEMGYVGENDPANEADAFTGEVELPSNFKQGIDNFFRHINFGIEILPAKYLSLFASFNYDRNKDMKLLYKRSGAGFSYGFALNIKSIQFSYARAHYMVGGVPNYFTLALNINALHELSQQGKTKKLQKVKSFN